MYVPGVAGFCTVIFKFEEHVGLQDPTDNDPLVLLGNPVAVSDMGRLTPEIVVSDTLLEPEEFLLIDMFPPLAML